MCKFLCKYVSFVIVCNLMYFVRIYMCWYNGSMIDYLYIGICL